MPQFLTSTNCRREPTADSDERSLHTESGPHTFSPETRPTSAWHECGTRFGCLKRQIWLCGLRFEGVTHETRTSRWPLHPSAGAVTTYGNAQELSVPPHVPQESTFLPLFGTPSQPAQLAPVPPQTPHASTVFPLFGTLSHPRHDVPSPPHTLHTSNSSPLFGEPSHPLAFPHARSVPGLRSSDIGRRR
eukprot:3936246-Rhodomonas_salina.1